MTWVDVDGEKLLEPPLNVKDFIRAIKASRPTVSGADLQRNTEVCDVMDIVVFEMADLNHSGRQSLAQKATRAASTRFLCFNYTCLHQHHAIARRYFIRPRSGVVRIATYANDIISSVESSFMLLARLWKMLHGGPRIPTNTSHPRQ